MTRLERTLWILAAAAAAVIGCSLPPPTDARLLAREPTQVFFGDTHVHTRDSSDARGHAHDAVDLDTAYRFARGLPVVHPATKARVQLKRPLDFIAVADHAEALDPEAWLRAAQTAEHHYVPCRFTTFIGWEWTADVRGNNLHRVVLMNRGVVEARELMPFSARDSTRPEALWEWLSETSIRLKSDFIAIPHGPNLSGGSMYAEVDSEGQPIGAAYARARMRWEPISEVTQIEGDSETHPALSPDDPFADFERYTPSDRGDSDVRAGGYARSALLRGIQIARETGANPFRFGMIGSTDSHTGLASADEANFQGAATGPENAELSAQGLIAVWAHENTRTAIFDAMKRREVYATTGPRIRVRFFGSWDFSDKKATRANMVDLGYTDGYPMGGELTDGPEGRAPSFMMYAVKDPASANLDRVQIIKGWVDAEGTPHERVYDVLWSPRRQVGPDGSPEPVVSTVELTTGRDMALEGAPSLHGFWADPDFDPELPAFYYMRVLEVPTPRHTLYNAIAGKTDPREGKHPATIQERAYTTPIWYTP